jgi:hypothetical protein
LPVFPEVQVISFSSNRRLKAEDLAVLGTWPRLHSILVNGVLLGPRLVDELRTRRHSVWRGFTPNAEAAAPGAEIDNILEVASKPLEDKGTRRFAGFEGLKRVHEAEASLEDVTAAPSNPMQDTFQENEKNFLGEITVNTVPQKKKK